MRNRLLLAVLLVAGALVPRVAAAESRADAIQAVLDEREAAIRTGDRETFLATVDPGADKEFKARQAALFDGLRSVPLSSYELIVRPDEVPDLAGGLDERYTADDVFLPPVESRYRIEGVDAVDALDGFFYTFLLRQGRWRIVSDTDVEDLGLPSSRNLWDFGPVARARSPHFTVLFDSADRTRAESLLRLAEEARDQLATSFNRPLPDQVLLILPHSVDQLAEMLQSTFDLSNFVAFAAASVDRDEGWESTAPRVFAQDVNLARSRRSFQLETLHHEFVHVAAYFPWLLLAVLDEGLAGGVRVRCAPDIPRHLSTRQRRRIGDGDEHDAWVEVPAGVGAGSVGDLLDEQLDLVLVEELDPLRVDVPALAHRRLRQVLAVDRARGARRERRRSDDRGDDRQNACREQKPLDHVPSFSECRRINRLRD